ncbi:glycosyltransferase family 2 protein [Cryptosporangium aurantiacum]|uniref:Glycosyltransferase, catalytic subunit of cellulose synthase and poly-beta-1,6-N-acetylglucosamine synthase n=1 Tax=Cryptosporangium aurantiacum TaxID=134849 RepID=A0A1M7RJR3_9ACTN|nr:glycosyltransferase [Cryptosporangium aurantiacum]SHN46391.1 Glycosyltransferase, catalytic subunit of cellulose synthase and poly-beta-1,6-N-acetylglucosamine synthase [Cryptosporangium aurantiacum]
MSEPPLGELLVDAGLITPAQRDWALDTQRRTGSRLGAILVAAGIVRRQALYRFLAERWNCPFVDVAGSALDPALLGRVTPEQLAREGWIPIGRGPAARGPAARASAAESAPAADAVLVATVDRPTAARRAHIEKTLGETVDLGVTTEWDLIQGLHRGYQEVIADQASLGLWRRNATQSARTVLLPAQKVGLAAAVAVIVAAAVLAPEATAAATMALLSVILLAGVAFKFVVCMVGARHERDETVTDDDVRALSDENLPMYTVLVPVYREANVVSDLLKNLGDLDWPRERLEVLLLLEADDTETIAAARAADPPATFTFVVVPDDLPKTKPKACNVGLYLARGEYLVIYDAEDRPDPDQLKKALLTFRRGGDDLVCVQAALNYWNADENWLTRMFTLEYSFWFDYMLPGLERLRLPIPLGGTSNHFRVDALRELGGWDPFNVTEDADLGIRAAALGRTVGVVHSTTYEEANRAGGNWIRQRSRWIKGYLQTLLVHARRPGTLIRAAGTRQTCAFVLLIGGTPATFLATPPLFALFAVSLFLAPGALAAVFPGWVLWLSLVNLLLGNGLMIYVSMMGAFKRGRYGLVLWALLNPAYWLFHSVASYKALWQLVTKPHYWEKTLHGLSTVAPTGSAAGLEKQPVAG